MPPLTQIRSGLRVGVLRRLFGRLFVAVLGWRVVGQVPFHVPRAVVIASPHTSYWDGVLLVALSWSVGLRLSWMVKHTVLRFPFRAALLWLGAVPIDRRIRAGVVEQVAAQLRGAEQIHLAIAPSGTRKKMPYWRSGFYRIALAADVPVICGYLDYAHKVGGFGEPFTLSGDVGRDMDHIRAFYEGMVGKRPERMGLSRLRDEQREE